MNIRLFLFLLAASVAGSISAQDANWAEGLDGFFSEHCYECHDDEVSKGGLNLLDLGTDLHDAELMRRWVLTFDKVAAGEMPPEKKPRPSDAEQAAFLKSLGDTLHTSDMERKEVVLRRLNRLEYENTLRDLFSLPHLNVKDLLPEDASAHGFDTIGDALELSTEQMLVYLDAADHLLDEAMGPAEEPETKTSTANLKTSSGRVLGKLFRDHEDGVVLFSSDYSPSAFRGFEVDQPGVYRFTLRARPFQSEKSMIVRVYAGDLISKRRKQWLVGHFELKPGDQWTEIKFEEFLQPRDTVQIVTYRNGGHEKEAQTTKRSGVLVGDATCVGPIVEEWPPPSRRKVFGRIDPDKALASDADEVLKWLLPYFYRRTVQPEEVEPYRSLTRAAIKDGRPWMEALRIGIKAMMVSPEFLFLEEPGREQVSDFALASRLSYFLWKTTPDRELLSLAAQEKLQDADVLHKQVERLLKDPKSQRFIDDFTGQWLDLYEIDFTEPDKHLFPEYDELLRAAMLAESRGFFTEILQNDLSVANFIDSDWTILNSRLAEHYGVPGVEGLEYRRVALPPDSPRGGLPAQAAIHKVTANGTNTSPVLRGNWMLENVFGEPVPPPPPNVPAVEPDITGATSLRELLTQHSESKACAGCHVKIDPPGFALEQFDPIGGWRDWYRSMGNGEPIVPARFADAPINQRRVRYRKGLDVDASGTTSDGFAFADFKEFKAHLAGHPEMIAKTLTEKLLAYGLGRGMGFSDRPEIEKIVKSTTDTNYGFRTLIHAVVQSPTFRKP